MRYYAFKFPIFFYCDWILAGSRLYIVWLIEALVILSSVYTPFSNRVGFSRYNIPSPRVFIKSIGAEFLQPDVFLMISWIMPTVLIICIPVGNQLK